MARLGRTQPINSFFVYHSVTSGVSSPTADDAVGLADSVVFDVVHIEVDSIGSTDSSISVTSRSVTDDTGLTDGVSSAVVHTGTDSTGLTDSSASNVTHVITDDTGLTDSTSRAASKVVTQTDNSGLADNIILFVSYVKTDNTGLIDSTSTATSHVTADNTGLTDTAIESHSYTQTQDDQLGLTDSFGSSLVPQQDISVHRWIFTNPASPTDSYTFVRNPTDMSSVFPEKNVQMFGQPLIEQTATYTNHAWGTTPIAVLAKESLPAPVYFQFSGITATQQAYTDLKSWCDRAGRLYLTDHFSRKWEVQIVGLHLEAKNSVRLWRLHYTINAYIYRRVS